MSVESQAISIAIKLLEDRGYQVDDVSHTRGHNGYDLIAVKESERLLIEVKGCTREWNIPDLYVTEFDEDNKQLTADFLCIVYLLSEQQPSICMIPRNAIPPEYITPKYGWRISKKFKKERVLRRFIVAPESDDYAGEN